MTGDLTKLSTIKEKVLENNLSQHVFLQWFAEKQARNVYLWELMFSKIAEDLVPELKISYFKATNG